MILTRENFVTAMQAQAWINTQLTLFNEFYDLTGISVTSYTNRKTGARMFQAVIGGTERAENEESQ